MRPAHCIEDLRTAARRRLPRIVFDYLDGGAGLDTGVRHNIASFDRVKLMMRSLVGVEDIDLSVQLFGRTWSLPFGTAPIGLANIIWPGAAGLGLGEPSGMVTRHGPHRRTAPGERRALCRTEEQRAILGGLYGDAELCPVQLE